jgi:hypothetical protein
MILVGAVLLIVGYVWKIQPLIIVGWVLVLLGFLFLLVGSPVY